MTLTSDLLLKINLYIMIYLFQGEKLETVTTAVVCLFSTQTQLLDQVPQLGYIPKVFTAMKDRNTAVPKSAIQICHQLAGNEVGSPFPS